MKYFDRKAFSIEKLFDGFLPSDYSLDEQNSDISNQSQLDYLLEQKDFLEKVYAMFKAVISKEYDMLNFVPKELVKELEGLNDSQTYLNKRQKVKKLFDWIIDCKGRNKKNLRLWKATIYETSKNLEWNSQNYFSKLKPERFPFKVKISMDSEGTLYITNDSISWGKFVFAFPKADISHLDFQPCEGWMWWMEIEQLESGFDFRILLDIEAAEMTSVERLMQDRGWLEISIQCNRPELQIEFYDYTSPWYETGCQSTKIFLESAIALVNKENTLGIWFLNEKERELVNLIQLYSCFIPALNPSLINLNSIDTMRFIEVVENRFGFEQACKLIEKAGDMELAKAMEKCAESLKHMGRNIKFTKHKDVVNLLNDRNNSAKGRILYHNLASMMCNASSTYEKKWKGHKDFILVRNAIKSSLEPRIFEMGFTGEFPHYRRRIRRKGEYLTIFYNSNTTQFIKELESSERGCVKISLLIGRAKLSKEDKEIYSLSGLAFEKSNVWDCLWERAKCRFAGIGPSDDEGWFTLDLDYNNSTTLLEDLKVQVSDMIPYLQVAKCIFQNRPVPKFYVKHHREFLRKNRVARKLAVLIMISSILFGFCMWVGFDIIMPFILNEPEPQKEMSTTFDILFFSGIGGLFGLVFGGYIYYDIRRKVWTQ